MRQHRTKVTLLVAIMLGAWGFQIGHAAGDLTCRASLVHVKGDSAGPLSTLDVELVIANSAGTSCEAATAGIIGGGAPLNGETLTLPSSLGTIRVLYASTNFTPFGQAGAEAGVAKVRLTIPGVPTIDAEVLTSQAAATCDPTNTEAAPTLSSSSEVARVAVAGDNVIHVPDEQPGGGHAQDIALGPLGTLHLNYTETDATSVTQRALFLDTGIVDVTISESKAGWSGATPCSPPPPPKQCSDGNDNDGDGKIDEADPGCHTDGNPDNPASYDPNDDDEEDAIPQCRDGADNDGDGKIDHPADPGCSSPDDDSELDNPQCSDGNDNDGDGKIDHPADPGCTSPDDNDETDGGGAECSDGVDNDDAEDDEADTDDPDCHSDFDPDNDDSYTPGGSEGCDEIPADDEMKADSGDKEDDLGEADDEDCDGAERENGNGDD